MGEAMVGEAVVRMARAAGWARPWVLCQGELCAVSCQGERPAGVAHGSKGAAHGRLHRDSGPLAQHTRESSRPVGLILVI